MWSFGAGFEAAPGSGSVEEWVGEEEEEVEGEEGERKRTISGREKVGSFWESRGMDGCDCRI